MLHCLHDWLQGGVGRLTTLSQPFYQGVYIISAIGPASLRTGGIETIFQGFHIEGYLEKYLILTTKLINETDDLKCLHQRNSWNSLMKSF